ncbi:MAG: hypothetical protein H0V51_24665 [Chloroflexi bacterium]|nr:hypothetical protein [Chloroflexota bacterium]
MTNTGTEPFGHPKGVVAVLDTSVLVRAWLSPAAAPNPSRRIAELAGVAYDSFTSPAILDEVEEVLAQPRFGAAPTLVRLWLDVFLRAPTWLPAPGTQKRDTVGKSSDVDSRVVSVAKMPPPHAGHLRHLRPPRGHLGVQRGPR